MVLCGVWAAQMKAELAINLSVQVEEKRGKQERPTPFWTEGRDLRKVSDLRRQFPEG